MSDPAADFSGGQMPRGLVVVAALAIVGLAVAASLVFAIAVRPRLELPTLGGGGESPGTGGAPRRADTADGRRLADAAQAGLLELERGDPGEGVVACWVLLERAAADAGTHRARPDTPSELAGRLIDRHEVSAAPLLRLAELYREARYSRHVLPEAARDEARAALEQVAAELGDPAGRLAPGGAVIRPPAREAALAAGRRRRRRRRALARLHRAVVPGAARLLRGRRPGRGRVLAAVRAVAPPPAGRAGARARPPVPDDGLIELTALEHRLSWGSVDADRFRERVRPLLVDLTLERLRARHGVDPATQPEVSRRILGEPLWQMVTGPPPSRGPSRPELDRLVEAMERI